MGPWGHPGSRYVKVFPLEETNYIDKNDTNIKIAIWVFYLAAGISPELKMVSDFSLTNCI